MDLYWTTTPNATKKGPPKIFNTSPLRDKNVGVFLNKLTLLGILRRWSASCRFHSWRSWVKIDGPKVQKSMVMYETTWSKRANLTKENQTERSFLYQTERSLKIKVIGSEIRRKVLGNESERPKNLKDGHKASKLMVVRNISGQYWGRKVDSRKNG